MNKPDSTQLRDVSLDDKYELNTSRAFMTGIEALVRLPLLQHQKDLDAGLNTAGFISGYRGSPLGTLDQSLWQAKSRLDKHNIHFQPGVNEDLAATSVWGTQQVHLLPGAKYDGVFSMWYGKGPGVDRSMDVIKHANLFGTTKHGGVLAVAGDDHACKSSTVPHQSEHMFIAASVPVLNPANVQEVLDYGIYGWALSRFSGCWVGLKAITENMDSAVSADLNPDRVQITLPRAFEEPEGGLNAQWPSTPLEQERLLNKYRIYAARAFAFSNNLNTIELDTPEPRLGIVTSGKSYLDVMEALQDLGIDNQTASDIGIRVFKIGMSWPLEPFSTHQFARGLKEILVVEEKRSVIEDQITGQLYNWPVDERPVVVGEFDENGNDLITNLGELTPAIIARVIGSRITRFYESKSIIQRLEFLDAKEERLSRPNKTLTRTPYFCSGCPHNTSTKVPEGSAGFAGIGCHYMVRWMDRNTETFTQMGGEGASWIGQAPFTETQHVFQNLGDGTYFHSGILAIRAAIASAVNITYKLLYNDAVAMTGGQPLDGSLKVSDMVSQLLGEGVQRLAVVAEDFEKSKAELKNIAGITIHPKSEFDLLQEQFKKVKGTSIIIFDQTCAAEKRRRRKRGLMPQNPTRVFIHPDICEGCGDCSAQSNCLSVIPKKTETGIKRQIDQDACNRDFSCLKGFCPSFITVTGGQYSATDKLNNTDSGFDMVVPEPTLPASEQPWNIVVTGIGGTGVLTVGSVLAMAAHLEGKGCSTLNQTGLAQKFGSVISHVRISKNQNDILAVRVPDGDADLLLGCDLVVSASPESLARLDPERSYSVINSFENATADFIHEKNYEFPADQMRSLIEQESGETKTHFVDATRVARDLLGNSIGSNMFLLGFAYQSGRVPVSQKAIFRAIEINGVSPEFNQQAFTWGRRAAVNPEAVEDLAGIKDSQTTPLTDLDDIIDWRYDYLENYQDRVYAQRYLSLVDEVKSKFIEIEDDKNQDNYALVEAVARNYFKLLSYKDEYEVARLMSQTSFINDLKKKYKGDIKIQFHMAPPILAPGDQLTGHPLKRKFPGVFLKLFSLISKFKFLRGGKFDPFGRTDERKQERQLIQDYENDIALVLEECSGKNFSIAVQLLELPDMIRGYGHVKQNNMEKYRIQRSDLKKKFDEPELVLVVNQ